MRRLLTAAVSAAIIFAVYWRIDFGNVVSAFRMSNTALVAIAILSIAPLTFGSALRFWLLTRPSGVTLHESLRMILVAGTMNLILPSKMGDMAKAAVLVTNHGVSPGKAISLTAFDKLIDLASLLVLGLTAISWLMPTLRITVWGTGAASAGLLLAIVILVGPWQGLRRRVLLLRQILPSRVRAKLEAATGSWDRTMAEIWADKRRAFLVLACSLLLWSGHLLQFSLFCLSLGVTVPLLNNAAYACLSILAGLLPITVAGIGSRDAAIIYFYSSYLTAGQAAAVGVLATTIRYLIPALAGLPFSIRYVHGSHRAPYVKDPAA